MNKLILCVIIISTMSLHAQESTQRNLQQKTKTKRYGTRYTKKKKTRRREKTKKIKLPTELLPSWSIGLSGGYGTTYPGGDVLGAGDEKRNIDYAWQTKLYGLYRMSNVHELLFACGYTNQTLSVSRSFSGQPMDRKVETTFIDVSFGYRYLPEGLYFTIFEQTFKPLLGTGLFCGYPIGTWTSSSDLNGNVTESDIPSNRMNINYGVYFEIGLASDWKNKYRTYVAMKGELGIARVYENPDTPNDDSLAAYNLLLMIGVEYHIQ